MMMTEPPEHIPEVSELGAVHLIGVGGRGMSGIARILSVRGVPVTGSDAKPSAAVTALEAVGIQESIREKNLGVWSEVEIAIGIGTDKSLPNENLGRQALKGSALKLLAGAPLLR